ncbi:MAG TPA: glycosyltransferase family 9 protein [Thermoanaerobaculia bacterium]|nr:glycosyltransferase family 9 protein [Thermoanaerobaculia bacterium]
MKRILLVRLGHLGDIVHGLPSAAALRDLLPGVRIGWVVEQRWTELLAASGAATAAAGTPEKPLVDDLHAVNTGAWRRAPLASASWSAVRQASRDVRAAGYDAVIDLQGLWKSALLARWSGAPVRIGFSRPKEAGVPWLYTRRVKTRRSHVIEQNLELVEGLTGQPTGPVRFALPRDLAAEDWCEQELSRLTKGPFAVLSPGAGWGAKLWPAGNFAGLARALARQAGLTSLVNISPDQENLGKLVESASEGSARTIDCSIGRLVALMRRASLAVGGDTGPIHLAAALGIPVVALFGPTNPERNGPWGARATVLRSPASRTSYAHVNRPDAGLRSISVENVVEAALRLLGTKAADESRDATAGSLGATIP